MEPPELLALTPEFVDDLARRLPAWRRVAAAGSRAGLAAPGMAVSLAWYDTLTTARGSACRFTRSGSVSEGDSPESDSPDPRHAS